MVSPILFSSIHQVKRPGDKNVRCTILLLLDYQPLQFKLDPRLARLLGVHTQTRPVIIQALWQYIKTHKLQVKIIPIIPKKAVKYEKFRITVLVFDLL